jgi:hypothetical protein
MSTTGAGSQAAGAARNLPPSGTAAARVARWVRAGGLVGWRVRAGGLVGWPLRVRGLGGRRARSARLAVVSAGTVLLAAACGGSPGPAASALYQRSLTYSRCMRSHGVLEFPILRQGPGGTLAHPVSPPTGMLSSPGYDAAFRACLKLAVGSGGGGFAARYRATALRGLKQAECMRAHGVTNYPSPAALDGGLHSPDFTTIGLDPHTLEFQAAAQACGMGLAWQVVWWWPAGVAQPGPAGPGPAGPGPARSVRQ